MKNVAVILFLLVVLLVPFRGLQAQADLIIATNAEITFPSCTDEITHFYYFTVVDDGGGIGTPDITGLDYVFGPVNQINVYDSGEYTYATFEVAVTVPTPEGTNANDCFAITYEGESVNPCFDVTRPLQEVCSIEEQSIPACINGTNGLTRVVEEEVACRKNEYRVLLLVPTSDAEAAAARLQAPAPERVRTFEPAPFEEEFDY